MQSIRSTTTAIALAALPVLLCACAPSDELPDPYEVERRGCPNVDVLVCKVDKISKTEGVRERDVRICQCRPPDQIDF